MDRHLRRERRDAAHHDFRLVERAGRRGGADGVADALRAAWALPTDTFVTAEFPLLLTILGQPSAIRDDAGPSDGHAEQPGTDASDATLRTSPLPASGDAS